MPAGMTPIAHGTTLHRVQDVALSRVGGWPRQGGSGAKHHYLGRSRSATVLAAASYIARSRLTIGLMENGRNMSASAAAKRLSQKAVTQALDRLSWTGLKTHLDSVDLDADAVDALFGHIRRCGRLILRRPDAAAEARRDALLDGLALYLDARADATARAQIEDVRAALQTIEGGYRGLLAWLASSEISKLLPPVRVAAHLERAVLQYGDMWSRVEAAVRSGKALNAMGPMVLKGGDGHEYSPDAVSDAIVTTLGNTLLMEGYANGWFDKDDLLVIPKYELAGEDAVFKAGSSEVLGMCWRRWERVEERHRFLGTELKQLSQAEFPPDTPPEVRRMFTASPTQVWFEDVITNERLRDRLQQIYNELSLETRARERARGISAPAPLLPTAFVSADEAHAGVALSEMLGYFVGDDQAEPAGLRLVEWLRGYAYLKCVAGERVEAAPNDVVLLDPTELASDLQRLGLRPDAATAFLAHASLGRKSRDMYDCPLVRTEDGKLFFFAPGLFSADLSVLILSNIGRLKAPLSQKGFSFEATVRGFFGARGMRCRGFKVKRGGEEYQFDAVLVWGDYVFLFECKNHGLSGHNPAQAYYFDFRNREDAEQTLRLAGALDTHSDILVEQFGPDTEGKKIVACVLNSLPFSLPGMRHGVYFTDWSAIKRFFKERYTHVKSLHNVTDDVKLMHRSAIHSFWKGDQPTPADLIAALDRPLQFELLADHMKLIDRYFPIDRETVVFSREYLRTGTTPESLAESVGIRPERLRADIKRVERGVADVRCRHARKIARSQDRAWREMQKRR